MYLQRFWDFAIAYIAIFLHRKISIHSISQVPSVLEYAAYIFNFQTVICGPLVFYADFMDFVDGTKLRKAGLNQYPSAVVCVRYLGMVRTEIY